MDPAEEALLWELAPRGDSYLELLGASRRDRTPPPEQSCHPHVVPDPAPVIEENVFARLVPDPAPVIEANVSVRLVPNPTTTVIEGIPPSLVKALHKILVFQFRGDAIAVFTSKGEKLHMRKFVPSEHDRVIFQLSGDYYNTPLVACIHSLGLPCAPPDRKPKHEGLAAVYEI